MLQNGVIRSSAFDTIKPKKLKFESCFFYLVKDQNTEFSLVQLKQSEHNILQSQNTDFWILASYWLVWFLTMQ
jgi:hypothetical protein